LPQSRENASLTGDRVDRFLQSGTDIADAYNLDIATAKEKNLALKD
jgi:hypothetical protein